MEHTGGVLSSVHPRVGCSAAQKGPRFLGQTLGSRSPCRALSSHLASPGAVSLLLLRKQTDGPRESKRYTCHFLQHQVSALRRAVRAALPRALPLLTPDAQGPRGPRCQ